MVVTRAAPTAETGRMQERTAAPSRWTVHAPHWAMPQPNLGPRRPMASRKVQRRGVSEATSTVWSAPFTLRVYLLMVGGLEKGLGGGVVMVRRRVCGSGQKSLIILGSINVESAAGEWDGFDLAGMAKGDALGAAVAMKGAKLVPIAACDEHGRAPCVAVLGDDDGAGAFAVGGEEFIERAGVDGGLIAGKEDEGLDFRLEGFEAGADGGAEAGVPMIILDDADGEAIELRADAGGVSAEDHGDRAAMGSESGLGGAAEEGCAIEGEELLGLAEAGGAAGGEEDQADLVLMLLVDGAGACAEGRAGAACV